MKKIKIALTPDELASIIHLASEKEKELDDASVNKSVSLGIVDKLTQNLSDDQKGATILAQVTAAISRLTGVAVADIKPGDQLNGGDLKMTSVQIRSLGGTFTNIAQQYKAGAKVTPDECAAQNTVQDCAALIIKKI